MDEFQEKLTIFICYAREDIEAAERLYEDLKEAGTFPWIDEESILGGEEWEVTIRKAIKKSRYFLALLSSNSVTKKGFVNKEITQALEILDEFPESEIFIIPVRLDDCTPSHEKIKKLQWVDIFPKWEKGIEKILRTVIMDYTNRRDKLDIFLNHLSETFFSGKHEKNENIQRTIIDSLLEGLSGFRATNNIVRWYTRLCIKDKKLFTIEELLPMLQKIVEDRRIDNETKENTLEAVIRIGILLQQDINKKITSGNIILTNPETGEKEKILESDSSKKVERKIRKILPSSSKMEYEEGLIAVIVGIDDYMDCLSPLHCAVNDAVYLTETLQKVWKDRRVIIKTLIGPSLYEKQTKNQGEKRAIDFPKNSSAVTRENILSVVRECAHFARELDTFIFYFSGHGALMDEEPSLITVGEGKTAKGIETLKIREIQEVAEVSASIKKVMIFDCCLSPRPGNKIVEGYKNLRDLAGEWSIFLSCSPGEASLEDQYCGDRSDDYMQQGIFTASLVEGLRGGATSSDGSVSLAELASFVSKRVSIEYQERLATLISTRYTGKRVKDIDQTRKNTEREQVKENDQLREITERKKVKEDNQTRIHREPIRLSQNPVLLSESIATGGPLKITMAPGSRLLSYMGWKKSPSRNFIKYWFKFLLGKWPITFPGRLGFRLGAFWYAAAMMLTVLWYFQNSTDNTPLIFLGIVGIGSLFLWWGTLPLAVAANEDRWHPGGYLTFIFYTLWHCMVAIGFAELCSAGQSNKPVSDSIFYLALDLFFILVVVIICGCNASQTIIVLAETIRSDERREIRQAVRAFQQFKYKTFGVDLYNYVPMISARPEFYLFILGLSILFVVLYTFIVMIAENMDMAILRVFFIRNIIASIFVTWLVFWYQAAFKYIQRQVYRL